MKRICLTVISLTIIFSVFLQKNIYAIAFVPIHSSTLCNKEIGYIETMSQVYNNANHILNEDISKSFFDANSRLYDNLIPFNVLSFNFTSITKRNIVKEFMDKNKNGDFDLVYKVSVIPGLLNSFNVYANKKYFFFGMNPECGYFNKVVNFKITTTPVPVPEPSSIFLLSAGFFSLMVTFRKKL